MVVRKITTCIPEELWRDAVAAGKKEDVGRIIIYR